MTEHALRWGDRIRIERDRKGLSKKALAEMVGITPTYMDKIEKNQSMPTAAIMAKIARVFGKGVNYFLVGEFGTVELPEERVDRELAKELSGRENPTDAEFGPLAGILKRDYRMKKAVLEFIKLLEL